MTNETEVQALTDLLAKVEAGKVDHKASIPTFAVMFAELTLATLTTNLQAYRAYNGSLDAAKALHEAVLPECGRSVDATMPEAGICVEIHREAQAIGKGDNTCEARAWLIAIIKALIAEETDNEQ